MKLPGGILITRPLGQQAQLKARLEQAGIKAWFYPTIQITPIKESQEHIDQALQAAHWLIFPSGNAVECGWGQIQDKVNHFTKLAAVGKATAEKLKQQTQKSVLYPQTTQDSEGLLECPEFENPTGQSIVIIKGEGGRTTLKETLEQRGAVMQTLNVYKRELPEPNHKLLNEALAHHPIILTQSAESIDNLKTMAGQKWHEITQRHFAVTHPKIAEHAKSMGITQIHLLENTTEALVNLFQSIAKQTSV